MGTTWTMSDVHFIKSCDVTYITYRGKLCKMALIFILYMLVPIRMNTSSVIYTYVHNAPAKILSR